MMGYHPPARHTNPARRSPRQGRHPSSLAKQTPWQGRRAPWQGRPPLCSACWEIRSTRGRYAPYWNAILVIKHNQKYIATRNNKLDKYHGKWNGVTTPKNALSVNNYVRNYIETRMHSSMMRTSRSSSHHGGSPPGTTLPRADIAPTRHPPQDQTPPGADTIPGTRPPHEQNS